MADDASRTSATLLNSLRDQGDPAAWAAFAQRYQASIAAWCGKWGMQPADADDLRQQLLLDIRTKLASYDAARGRFRPWLRAVTRNAYLNFVRSRPRSRAAELWEDLPAREDLQREIDREADHEILAAALERARLRVKPKQWDIFHALAFENRRGEEVAQAWGMTASAVLMVKCRVLKLVKAEIEELGGNEGEGGADREEP